MGKVVFGVGDFRNILGRFGKIGAGYIWLKGGQVYTIDGASVCAVRAEIPAEVIEGLEDEWITLDVGKIQKFLKGKKGNVAVVVEKDKIILQTERRKLSISRIEEQMNVFDFDKAKKDSRRIATISGAVLNEVVEDIKAIGERIEIEAKDGELKIRARDVVGGEYEAEIGEADGEGKALLSIRYMDLIKFDKDKNYEIWINDRLALFDSGDEQVVVAQVVEEVG